MLQEEKIKYFEKEVKSLLLKIRGVNNINDAEEIFKKLEDIQTESACLLFKYDINVSPFMRQFIYDFDRIDDIEVKMRIYTTYRKDGNTPKG